MKPLLAVGLATTLIGCAGAESASRYEPAPAYVESADPSYDPPPNYRHDEPQYYEPRYYRHYGQPGYYDPPRRYRRWNGCQPGYTVQDGLCKPYRGY